MPVAKSRPNIPNTLNESGSSLKNLWDIEALTVKSSLELLTRFEGSVQ